MPESGACSFLDLINDADNVRLERTAAAAGSRTTTPLLVDANFDSEPLVPWYVSTGASGRAAVGLLRPAIVVQLRKENEIRRGLGPGLPQVWDIVDDALQPNGEIRTLYVAFKPWADTPAKRTAVMKEMCERWRDQALFPDICGPRKWRGEMYPVYARPFGVHDYPKDDAAVDGMNFVFEMERSACALFGVVTYGVHMTIYLEEGDHGTVRVWVPKRASTKQTWPGYLDNSVAGGITSGMQPFESIVKESMEEASINEAVVRKHAKSVGAMSYFFRTPKGWLQPEIQYMYDLQIPSGVDPAPFQPKPLDGEVESFELLPLDQVIAKMRSRLFKTNCALVLIDFLIRHGHLTAENEPDLMDIIAGLHGRFDFTKW